MRHSAFHGHKRCVQCSTRYTAGASWALVAPRQTTPSLPRQFLGPDTMYKTIRPPCPRAPALRPARVTAVPRAARQRAYQWPGRPGSGC